MRTQSCANVKHASPGARVSATKRARCAMLTPCLTRAKPRPDTTSTHVMTTRHFAKLHEPMIRHVMPCEAGRMALTE